MDGAAIGSPAVKTPSPLPASAVVHTYLVGDRQVVGLVDVQVRVVERRHRPEIAQELTRIVTHDRVEDPGVREVGDGVAVVVDLDVVLRVVGPGVEVRAAVGLLERDPVRDQGHRAGVIRAGERIHVGVVGAWIPAISGASRWLDAVTAGGPPSRRTLPRRGRSPSRLRHPASISSQHCCPSTFCLHQLCTSGLCEAPPSCLRFCSSPPAGRIGISSISVRKARDLARIPPANAIRLQQPALPRVRCVSSRDAIGLRSLLVDDPAGHGAAGGRSWQPVIIWRSWRRPRKRPRAPTPVRSPPTTRGAAADARRQHRRDRSPASPAATVADDRQEPCASRSSPHHERRSTRRPSRAGTLPTATTIAASPEPVPGGTAPPETAPPETFPQSIRQAENFLHHRRRQQRLRRPRLPVGRRRRGS